jgi:Sec-independent protein translocase protein TatA
MELSMFEMIAVAVIALLVLGPEEMVRQSQRLGRFVAKLRTQLNNFKVMVETEVTPESKPPAIEVVAEKKETIK